jgi:hypothetical protein
MLAEPQALERLDSYRRNPQLTKRYFPERNAPSSGDQAVAGARYGTALKSATTEQQVRLAPEEMRRHAMSGRFSAPENAGGAVPIRYIGTRTFVWQNGLWLESSLRESRDNAARRIEFDSGEYWDFLSRNPELKEVLALGPDVRFLLDGKICEIYRKNK